jgi:hypothetical protein
MNVYLWAVMAAFVAFGAGNVTGRMQQSQKDELAQLQGFHEQVLKSDEIQKKLDQSQSALRDEQAKKQQIQTVEVIKWRTKYETKMQDPDIVKCVADSGLLDEYNAAFPTAAH